MQAYRKFSCLQKKISSCQRGWDGIIDDKAPRDCKPEYITTERQCGLCRGVINDKESIDDKPTFYGREIARQQVCSGHSVKDPPSQKKPLKIIIVPNK